MGISMKRWTLVEDGANLAHVWVIPHLLDIVVLSLAKTQL